MPPSASTSRRPARGGGRAAAAPAGVAWDEVALAPVVLVTGPEELLAERAVDRLVAQARERDPQVEVTRLDGSTYGTGQLTLATSPSLFAEDRVVVVEDHLGAAVPGARTWTLPFPAPDALRPFAGDPHVLDGPETG